MNKIMKTSLLLGAVATLGMMNTSAKTMTAKDIEEISKYTIEGTTEQQQDNIYILGKHVHFTMFTFADSMSVINTNDFDGDLEDAVLYRKDTTGAWSDAAYNKAISASDAAKLEFEMVRLIGEKGTNGHTSEDADLYTSNGEFITTVTPSVGRTYDEFVDATKDLMAVSVRPLQSVPNLGNTIYTDTNAYNMTAADAVFTHEQVKGETVYNLLLTENSPLLSYNRSGKGSGQWVGLLVKTNKALDKNKTLVVKFDNVQVNSDQLVTTDAKNEYGAESNEFVLWIKADAIKTGNANSIITIQQTSTKPDETEKAQSINVSFSATALLDNSRIVKEDNLEVKIMDNENVKVVYPKINGEYKEIFYTEKALAGDNAVKDFKFTENDNLMQAVKPSSTWNYADLIEVKSAEAVVDNSWNQSAITNVSAPVEHKYTTDEPYHYVITITTDHVLKTPKDVKLLMDLSANSINVTNASKSSVTNNKLPITVSFSTSNEVIVDFNNSDSSLGTIINNYSVLFVLNDETTPLSFDAYNADKTADLVYGNTLSNATAINAAYKHNAAAVTVNSPVVDENDSNKYAVRVQVNDDLLAIPTASGLNSVIDGTNKAIPVIVDLGFKLELQNTAQQIKNDNFSVATSSRYTVVANDIEEAKRLGAISDTAFVLWVTPSVAQAGQEFVFTKVDSNASITVKFEVREINDNLVDADLTETQVDKVVIAPEYSDEVKYLGSKKFAVNKDVTEFVATIDGVDYTYNITWNGSDSNHDQAPTSFKKVTNLNIKDAYKSVVSTADKFMQDSIERVTYNANNKSIEVVFNREVDKNTNFGLVLNLGIKVNGGTDKTDGADVAAATSHLTNEDISKLGDNSIGVVWLTVANIERSIDANGAYKFTVVHNDNGTKSVPVELTVTTRVENTRKDNIELKEENTQPLVVKEDSFDSSNSTKELFNNKSIKTEVNENGEIVIYYDRTLDTFTPTGAPNAKYFGVLVDLGIDPKLITTKNNYKFGAETEMGTIPAGLGTSVFDERTDAYKFGGTGTQFILWLDDTCFDDEYVDGVKTGRKTYSITFVSTGNTENKYSETEVTFVFVDATEKLSITGANKLDSNTAPKGVSDSELYKMNQERFDANYVETVKDDELVRTLTISQLDPDLGSYDYAIPTKAAHAWYAVVVDFGTSHKDGISLATANSGSNANAAVQLDPIEGSDTSYILWINLTDSALKGSSVKPIQLVDNYDSLAAPLELNIVIEK